MRRETHVQFTAGKQWTTEPTTITVIRTFNLPQYNGSYHYINPINSPYIVDGNAGFVSRVTASANVNMSGHATVKE